MRHSKNSHARPASCCPDFPPLPDVREYHIHVLVIAPAKNNSLRLYPPAVEGARTQNGRAIPTEYNENRVERRYHWFPVLCGRTSSIDINVRRYPDRG